MDRAQVVLHVGAHVWVRGAERGLSGARSCVRGESDQGDVRDDRAARQAWRSVHSVQWMWFIMIASFVMSHVNGDGRVEGGEERMATSGQCGR